MSIKPILIISSICFVLWPIRLQSDDRLAITFASFDKTGFDNYKEIVARYKGVGFTRISMVPTYYHEHLNEIIDTQTPSIDTIKACLNYLIDNGIKVIYKPHIDPVKYLYTYDIWSSDNSSWRVNVPWRGFFDFDPIESRYYEIVILPVLKCLNDILSQKQHLNLDSFMRLELGAELMNSMIRHGDKWVKIAQKAKEYIAQHNLGKFVNISHNFAHHIQIEEDYILRMNKVEMKWLKKYVELLDELSVSQYMDLTIFISKEQTSEDSLVSSVANAILFYHKRFREVILRNHLQVRNSSTIPINIGEFGIGVGGLKHPNYWEGRKINKSEQTIGIKGLLRALTLFRNIFNEGNLNATIWTIGPTYDVFGFSYSEGLNENVIKEIKKFLQ